MILQRIAIAMCAMAMASGLFAQTTTTTTRDISVGPVGVGSTETIQISVANLATNAQNGTAASCTGSISFNNSTGNAIGTSTSFTVTAGQIFSANLPFNKVTTGTARVEVIGVVALTTTSGNRAPCALHYSLETFDTATGATHIFINGNDGGNGGGPGRGN